MPSGARSCDDHTIAADAVRRGSKWCSELRGPVARAARDRGDDSSRPGPEALPFLRVSDSQGGIRSVERQRPPTAWPMPPTVEPAWPPVCATVSPAPGLTRPTAPPRLPPVLSMAVPTCPVMSVTPPLTTSTGRGSPIRTAAAAALGGGETAGPLRHRDRTARSVMDWHHRHLPRRQVTAAARAPDRSGRRRPRRRGRSAALERLDARPPLSEEAPGPRDDRRAPSRRHHRRLGRPTTRTRRGSRAPVRTPPRPAASGA